LLKCVKKTLLTYQFLCFKKILCINCGDLKRLTKKKKNWFCIYQSMDIFFSEKKKRWRVSIRNMPVWPH